MNPSDIQARIDAATTALEKAWADVDQLANDVIKGAAMTLSEEGDTYELLGRVIARLPRTTEYADRRMTLAWARCTIRERHSQGD